MRVIRLITYISLCQVASSIWTRLLPSPLLCCCCYSSPHRCCLLCAMCGCQETSQNKQWPLLRAVPQVLGRSLQASTSATRLQGHIYRPFPPIPTPPPRPTLPTAPPTPTLTFFCLCWRSFDGDMPDLAARRIQDAELRRLAKLDLSVRRPPHRLRLSRCSLFLWVDDCS